MTNRSFLPATIILVTLGAAAAPALADKPPSSAQVNLVESSKSGSKSLSFTLAMVNDQSPAQLSTLLAGAEYHVKLWRDSGKHSKAAPSLTVELDRHDAKGPGALSFRGTTSAPVGQRTTLLHLDRGDGTTYEVAVTLR